MTYAEANNDYQRRATMIFTSQSGRTSIKDPRTYRMEKDKKTGKWNIFMMDYNGKWAGMAVYPTEERCLEIKEAWMWEETISQKISEFRFPMQ